MSRFWAQAFLRPLGLFEDAFFQSCGCDPCFCCSALAFGATLQPRLGSQQGPFCGTTRESLQESGSQSSPRQGRQKGGRTNFASSQGDVGQSTQRFRSKGRTPECRLRRVAQTRRPTARAPTNRCLPGCAPARPPKTKICAWGRDDESTLSRDGSSFKICRKRKVRKQKQQVTRHPKSETPFPLKGS